MNRTLGWTLRQTLGGGAIVALGVGAISSAPHRALPLAAASTPLPISSSTYELDDPIPRQARAALMIYIEAAPQPRAIAAPFSATNGFFYGYCTWWVAHKRFVPWRGNAAQWWWNARPFGYAEGPAPRPGAIMVMGYGATSPQGHVALVENVNPNGSFLVSEMNWWGVPGGGWGRVDYRTVASMSGILGFIY